LYLGWSYADWKDKVYLSIADHEFVAAPNTPFRFKFMSILTVSSDKGEY
jgi:hypothetical protein